jgi:RNA polymerase sigma factor (sigma-70 family)
MNLVLRHLRRVAFLHDQDRLSDGQLLEQFVSQRAEPAFEALVRRHGPMVLGVCRRVLRNEADAEDAFQATFLVLVRKAGSVQPRELVGHWLHGVAYRTAVRAKALEARRRMKERAVFPPREAENGIWQDVLPLLDQELSGLPEKYRVPVVLCDLEGRSRKEAARVLGCVEGTLSSRLARARTLLAQRLSRRGVVLSGGALAALVTANGVSAAVPASLLHSTLSAALSVAAGNATAAACVSLNVATLTEGVLKSMFLAKLKTVIVLTCGVAALGLGTSGILYHARAGESDPGRSGLIASGGDDEERQRAEDEARARQEAEKRRREERELRERAKADRQQAEKALRDADARAREAREAEQAVRLDAEKVLKAREDLEKDFKRHESELQDALKTLTLQYRERAEQLERALKSLHEQNQHRAAVAERERAERLLLNKAGQAERGRGRGMSVEDKLDRILERLERMEQRLERLERGK